MNLTVGLAGSGADRIVSGTAEDEINQALADVGASGGGIVSILQGTYSVASSVRIMDDNVTLLGAGAGQTVLQTIPGWPTASAQQIIAVQGAANFAIQDLTVDGHTNGSQTNGIVTVECTNGVIASCEVLLEEAHNYGIWLVLSDHIDVLDNRIDGFARGTGQEGIESWSCDDILISGNTIVNIGGAGLNIGSLVTASYGDIVGGNSNIQITNNTIDNASYGISIGIAGPRSLNNVDVQGNSFTNIAHGVRLISLDRLDEAPDSEAASVRQPQAFNDINISGNQITLTPSSGFGIILQNLSSPGVTNFSDINALSNVISNAPGQPFSTYNFENFTLDGNILTGTATTVNGSPYNDTLLGTNLANILIGNGGLDTMQGGLGDDAYYVDSGDDVIVENADEGTDTAFASVSYTLSANVERISLANGNGTQATGNNRDNWFWGNSLNNILDGGVGSDTVDYSTATQTVVVDLPFQIATGNQIGTDTLYNIENVKTGSGNDAIGGSAATNILDGGAGTDTISYYAAASGVVLDLAAGVGVDGTSRDTLLNFENANGTQYNDAISGTAVANVLNGLGGIDTISYYLASQGVTIDLSANVAIEGAIVDTILNFENVNGSQYNDAISGNAGANVLDGLGGIDTLSYYTSTKGLIIDLAYTIVIDGYVTDIVRNFENVNATRYDDIVAGNAGANVLNGLTGTDTVSYYAVGQGVTINLLTGTAVSGGLTDTLLNFENVNGSAYADNITGDGGANVLNGFGGADTLTGGGGFDTFEFRAGFASGDVITDFTGNGAAAGDAIRLVGFGTVAQGATFTQIDATQWQIHSGLDGHNEIIKLSNAASVHATDFFFV